MLSQIAIFAAATALSAGSGQLLPAQSSWWERVDVTLSGNGATQTCEFTASHARAEHCDAVKASVSEAASPASAQLTKLTFERKFIPGDRAPGSVETDVGDTLIAAHMMELSIDASGAVSHCQVIASAGDERPDFGCEEAKAERYAATAGGSRGYMTIAVSAHREQIV